MCSDCVHRHLSDLYVSFVAAVGQKTLDFYHSYPIRVFVQHSSAHFQPEQGSTYPACICVWVSRAFFKKINSQEEKWWRSGHLSLLWFCQIGWKQTGLDNKTELTRLNGSEPSLMSLVTPAASECLQRAAESYMCFLRDAIQAIQLKVSQYFVCLEHRKFLWNQKETAGNSSPETVTCWVNALV